MRKFVLNCFEGKYRFIFQSAGKVSTIKDIHEQSISYLNQLKKGYDNQGTVVNSSGFFAEGLEHQEQLMKMKVEICLNPSYGKH